MSGIAGIFNRSGKPVEHGLPETMLVARPERGPDGSAVAYDGPAALGHQLFLLLPEDRRGEQPLVADGLLFAADCRLDNRAELARQLGLEAAAAATMSDAALILCAYRQWGERCPERLLGDFVFIVWDSRRQRLFAARDATGSYAIFYHISDTLCLMASEISQLLAHPAVEPRIHEGRVAAYLVLLDPRPGETFYDGILSLPPGHALSVTAGEVSLWRYWEPQPAPIRYKDERQYAERYHELLSEAVRCRLRSIGPVGISLSGGLDSTSLTALATPMLPSATGQRRLMSFSNVFDELASCDERVYIRPVVERYDVDATFINCDERWSLSDFSSWPVLRDFVMADSYFWLPDSIRQAAGDAGVKLLLAGYYGEYLMTGQNYWVLDMLRGGQLGLLGHTIRASHRRIRWRESFVDFGLRRMIPPGLAQAYRRLRPRSPTAVAPGIADSLVAGTDLQDRFSPVIPPSTLSAPGLQHRYQTMTGSSFGLSSSLRFLYNQRGIERVQPYTDRRLMEFVLSIPAYIIGRPGEDRRLHREAMSGLLPEDVRRRVIRTEFTPLMLKGLRDKEKDTIRRIMTNPQVVERGYIRADWLDARLQRDFDLSQDSLLLWLAISLELWLQRYWS